MTQRIYYQDSYLSEFHGQVVSVCQVEGKKAVELDRSCFYPASGGQPSDWGSLDGLSVIGMVDRDDRMFHLIEQGELEEGQKVHGSINWERRFDHMQQHTGQHILSQAFIQTLEADTLSFHLGREFSTIDLSRENLTREEIYLVEKLANQVIFECRPLRIHCIDASRQEEFPLRKLSARNGTLRIVEISDFDFSPCGGTHCRQTGEIGLIKIRRWERVRHRARVEFYCGWRALADYRWKNRSLYQLSRLYSRRDRDVVEAAQEHLDREKKQRKELAEFRDLLLDSEAAQLVNSSFDVCGVHVVRSVLNLSDVSTARDLAQKIVHGGSGRLALLGIGGKSPALVFAKSMDLPWHMGELIRKVAPRIKGRGGGNSKQAQAQGSYEEGLEMALQEALEELKEGR